MSASKKPQALGKGLDILIPTDFDSSLLNDPTERVQKLFIKDIKPNPEQPRKTFLASAIDELAESIKRFGILQPLIVAAAEDGQTYILIAGERRLRAAAIAGLSHVPVIVRKPKDHERLEIALIENVQRVDLSPLEQAVSIERLKQQFNISYQDIAKRLGKAETTINNTVRLLQLPPAAREALQNGLVTEGHSRTILSLKDNPKLQQALLDLIIKNHWSVRKAEQFVVAQKQGLSNKTAITKHISTSNPQTVRLTKLWSTPVKLKRTAKGGKVEIHFKNDQQLAQILKRLDEK